MPSKDHSPENRGVSLSFGSVKTGHARLPLRFLVMGNFSGSPSAEKPRFVRIDKHDFAEAMFGLGIELYLDVANHLDDQHRHLRITLPIRSIDDFTPGAILANVPELADIARLRTLIQEAQRGAIKEPDLRAGLRPFYGIPYLRKAIDFCESAFRTDSHDAHHGGAIEAKDSPPGGLFDLIDIDGSDSAPNDHGAEPMDALIGAIVGTTTPRAPTSDIGKALAFTAAMLNAQLNEILHDPAFQRMEASWRGLKFLVDRTDFGSDVRIDLIDVEKQNLVDCLALQLETGGAHNDTPTVALIDFALANTTADMDLLQALATTAESVQVPVLTNASLHFIGLDAAEDIEKRDNAASQFDSPAYDKWNSFRKKDYARWISLAFNRFLLRAAYSSSDRKAAGFDEDVIRQEHRLWGNPAWAIATLICQSFAKWNWPTQITGTNNGRLDNLHVYGHGDADAAKHIPLEVFLTEQSASDLATAGFIPLVCPANRDLAYLLYAPTAHRARRYKDRLVDVTSRIMSTFPYQLLATRVSRAVASNKVRLTENYSTREIQENFENFLWDLIADTGSGAQVEVNLMAETDPPYQLYATLTVTTGRDVLGGAPVELSVQI